ncbi:CxxH/CxxC protein [Paenibacillus thermotolerans]|uniref:CxxH/CxxC protein n=1 Tax=Paenibacillus thermotolerans TaxID=3027807 RepID=UPI002368D5DF|nr:MULTISPECIES: CxxH/CxxC protein [unclassified Paenibacillus]
MYCVCEEHLEIAIDRFIDEHEDAPDVVDLNEASFAAWEPPALCTEPECGRKARFLVV